MGPAWFVFITAGLQYERRHPDIIKSTATNLGTGHLGAFPALALEHCEFIAKY